MYDGLVVLLIRHGLAGAAAGWATAGLLLWTDTAGIGLLVATSDLWPIPLIMLVWSFGLTFGSVAMGAAIMGLGRRAAHDPSGGARANGRRFDARSRLGSGSPTLRSGGSGGALRCASSAGSWESRNCARLDSVGWAETRRGEP
jgi:hypothetical protein